MPESALLIPHEKFMLDNGLTVIVREDHKAPIVAVNIWYHVGSKNERRGKTGFAHLFEHLMFQGSENYNDEYFKPFEQVGATDAERHDGLRPHELLPERADDGAGHRAVDGVRPHGPPARRDRPGRGSTSSAASCRTRSARARTSPTAASSSDCSRATLPGRASVPLDCRSARWTTSTPPSLDDVKEWFRTLLRRGERGARARGRHRSRRPRKEKAQKYFGDIPPGPPLDAPAGVDRRSAPRRTRDVDVRPGARRRASTARGTCPATGTARRRPARIAAQVLGGGKTSRLYERLVYRDQIADNVSPVRGRVEIGGLFMMQADVKHGVDLRAGRGGARRGAQRASSRRARPRRSSSARKTCCAPSFVRGIERIGGFGGKADVLAAVPGLRRRPGLLHARRSSASTTATPAQVREAAAQRWLARRRLHARQCTPSAEVPRTRPASADRPQGRPADAGDASRT